MNVLIVDDEPVARRGLRRQLSQIPGVTCVGECATRDEAIAAVVEQRPDVVLLDVQLGRATAFEIIEAIGVDLMPFVIFVTAFNRHALKAFEVHALDYVLKPVDPQRLRESLDRAGSMLSLLSLQRDASLADRLEGLLADQVTPRAEGPVSRPERFVVKDGDRIAFVDIGQVEWFESDGNYVRVHRGGRSYVMRTTMDRVEQQIGAHGTFIRVRRSAIVNLQAIATLERYDRTAFVIQLHRGTNIISSRHYHAALRELVRNGR
ncbi:MAG: response regulator receiver [Gemmatimonadetes bacterium]|nr:response regulator receiver [Gemmatimonadota bacterium]